MVKFSLHYELQKHSGALPIVGVTTFLRSGSQRASEAPRELIRSSEEENQAQIVNLLYITRSLP
jgi:methylmalonyl-CoA mutase